MVTLCLMPVILVVGTFGNCLTIVIMSRQTFSGLSVSVYLRSLAISDMMCLFISQQSLIWIQSVTGISLMAYSTAMCKLHVWLQLTVPWISSWNVVAVTVERAIVVCLPLHAKSKCTRKRALYVCLAFVSIFSLANTHVIFTLDVLVINDTPECKYINQKIDTIVGICSVLLYSVLPMCAIISCNVILVRNLKDYHTSELFDSHSAQLMESRRQRNNHVVNMVVAASCAFVVLTLPFNVLVVVGDTLGVQNNTYDVFVVICDTMATLHHAINFILYALSGTTFREELAKICRCQNHKNIIKMISTCRNDTSTKANRESITRF